MADAATREARKKELLVESTILREKLAVEVLTVVHTPNAITNTIKIVQKIRAIGIKPFLIGGGLIAMLLLRPWRMFSSDESRESAKSGFFSTLLKYGSYALPVAKMLFANQMGGGLFSFSGIASFISQKIGGLFSKSTN